MRFKLLDYADKAASGAAAASLIGSNQIKLTCADVTHPIAVRYAWADNPAGTLFNADALPAMPFRTDDWPQ